MRSGASNQFTITKAANGAQSSIVQPDIARDNSQGAVHRPQTTGNVSRGQMTGGVAGNLNQYARQGK